MANPPVITSRRLTTPTAIPEQDAASLLHSLVNGGAIHAIDRDHGTVTVVTELPRHLFDLLVAWDIDGDPELEHLLEGDDAEDMEPDDQDTGVDDQPHDPEVAI